MKVSVSDEEIRFIDQPLGIPDPIKIGVQYRKVGGLEVLWATKVGFILVSEGNTPFYGYLCKNSDGEMWLIKTSVFEEEYKLVTH